MQPKLEITEETTQAIGLVVKNFLPQAVDEIFEQLRSHISPEQIRAKAKELLESEELRKEVSVRQVFLTLDLDEIQRANWADILNETKEQTEQVLELRKLEIKAANEKIRVLREVDLAEVTLNKARAEQDFDIALLRFRKIKGHIFLAAVFLVVGLFLGQAISSVNPGQQPTPVKVQKSHKGSSK